MWKCKHPPEEPSLTHGGDQGKSLSWSKTQSTLFFGRMGKQVEREPKTFQRSTEFLQGVNPGICVSGVAPLQTINSLTVVNLVWQQQNTTFFRFLDTSPDLTFIFEPCLAALDGQREADPCMLHLVQNWYIGCQSSHLQWKQQLCINSNTLCAYWSLGWQIFGSKTMGWVHLSWSWGTVETEQRCNKVLVTLYPIKNKSVGPS